MCWCQMEPPVCPMSGALLPVANRPRVCRIALSVHEYVVVILFNRFLIERGSESSMNFHYF